MATGVFLKGRGDRRREGGHLGAEDGHCCGARLCGNSCGEVLICGQEGCGSRDVLCAGLICVEQHLVQPTFITDFPTDISPLAKSHPGDPSITERFELFIAGMEIANGFSELNDPEDQERRFRAQVEKGGTEAPKEVDVDYIRALAHGLPPTAGEGVGIDRLAMLLTDSHAIREVILFPLLRPRAAAEAAEEASEGQAAQ